MTEHRPALTVGLVNRMEKVPIRYEISAIIFFKFV